MTEPVVCKKRKCEYEDERLNKELGDDCPDCDVVEQIEHDLLKQSKVKTRR